MKNLTATLNHRLHSAPRPGFRVSKHGKHRRGAMSADRNEYRRNKIVAYCNRKKIGLPVIQLSGHSRRRILDPEDWPAFSEWYNTTIKELRKELALQRRANRIINA